MFYVLACETPVYLTISLQLFSDVTPEFGSKSKAFKYSATCESDDEEEITLAMWGVAIESEEEEEELSSVGSGSEDDMSQSGSPPPDDAKSE